MSQTMTIEDVEEQTEEPEVEDEDEETLNVTIDDDVETEDKTGSEDDEENDDDLILSKRSSGGKTPQMKPSQQTYKSNATKGPSKAPRKNAYPRRGQGHSYKSNRQTGKGRGKGLGKGRGKMAYYGKTPIRHIKWPLLDNIRGITNPAIKRLARRGGVKRIRRDIYDATRDVLKQFITQNVGDAVTYMEHAKRKTVSIYDINNALRKNGHKLYGFGN